MIAYFRSSFRRRLFINFALIASIPLLLCSVFMLEFTRLQLSSSMEEEAQQQIAVLSHSLDQISDAINQASSLLRENYQVYHALPSQHADPLEINAMLYDISESGRAFADFSLYDKYGNCCFTTTEADAAQHLSADWGLLYGAKAAKGAAYYYASENPGSATEPLLTAAVWLRHDETSEGFLVMTIPVQGFHFLLDGKYPQNDILLLNSYFRPVYASRSYLNSDLAESLRQHLLRNTKADGESWHYSVIQHQPTGLHLVLRQSTRFVGTTLRVLYAVTLLGSVLSISIAIMLSLHLSRQISFPIQQLQEGFDRVEQDDLETQLPAMSEDEMGHLVQRFNNMVTALKSNRQALVRNEQELKEAQIRMMQAQLNPHFLCNTLDTMKWISKINRVPQVATMSTNLADILRFTISSDEFIPLYREMEILERYIEIQKIRLSDDFTFTTDIPEELYDCMVPKMILQPIVENAILHGLDGVEGCTIHVHAAFGENNTFTISVTDNGQGFPPEMVGRPYHRDKTLAKGHLGLYNVDTILSRYYGEACGLYLDNGANGIGASVSATLPIRYEEESGC